MAQSISTLVIVVLMLAGVVNGDIDKDRQECADQLIGLATCLPYVGGDAKAPTLDCCSGLKQVLEKNKICLCILVKDRNDPKLGLKINATLALGLPKKCNSPADVDECPSLLHLAPGSPDAKVFEDFANSSKGTISTPAGKGNETSDGSTSEAIKNDGGMERKWLGVEMAFGLLLFLFFFISSSSTV